MDPLPAKIIAATSGATITALTMTPFDVVKTRLQTQMLSTPSRGSLQTCRHPNNANICVRSISSLARSIPGPSPRFSSSYALPIAPQNELCVCFYEGTALKTQRVTGFWDAVIQVARHEGIRGLWKGVGTTLLIAVPSQSAYMVTYDHLNKKVVQKILPDSYFTPLVSGITARTVISTIASPLELLRTTLQSTPPNPNVPHTLSSVLNSTRILAKTQGLTALWRGLTPTLWRDVPFSGIYWANYETWKSTFRERYNRTGAFYEFISGAVSGITAAVITHPFDVAKTRRQALVLSQEGVPAQTMRFLLKIARQEGIPALYAGIAPRLAKIAPACGIMIASYEGVGRYITQRKEY